MTDEKPKKETKPRVARVDDTVPSALEDVVAGVQAAPPIPPGTVLGDRYRIGEPIGQGGMGTVYAGRDLLLDHEVALKFLQTGFEEDPRYWDILRQEVKLSTRVTHPNVARVHTLEKIDGSFFIVMELLSGEPLSRRLEAGRLAVADAMRYGREILAGLGAAHDGGVIHGDIKPDNVMLCDDGRTVLMDFGISRAHGTIHSAQVVGGTPAYMAPEVTRGLPIDRTSDLYSFGVVLYEMLAGAPPFGGPDVREVIAQHQLVAPPDVAPRAPGAAPQVCAAIMKLLAKDPAARFASARAVMEALASPFDGTLRLAEQQLAMFQGGAEAAQRLLAACLSEVGVADVLTPQDLLAVALRMIARGGMIEIVGRSLKLTAILAGGDVARAASG
jgi:serine/threonine protein kinase